MATGGWTSKYAATDDTEEEGGREIAPSRVATVLLIDASAEMFNPLRSEDFSGATADYIEEWLAERVPFRLALSASRGRLRNSITEDNRALLAVLLYNTTKDRNDANFAHVWQLQKLGEPSRDRIKMLDEYLEDDGAVLHDEVGSASGALINGLWATSLMFSNCKLKLDCKQVYVLCSTAMEPAARVKIADMRRGGVQVRLVPLAQPRLAASWDVADDQQELHARRNLYMRELLDRSLMKIYNRKAITRLPLSLAGGMKLSVGLYSLVQSRSKPPIVRTVAATNQPVEARRHFVLKTEDDIGTEFDSNAGVDEDDAGMVLLPSDIEKYQEFAGRRVIFDQDELRQMKRFRPPGLELQGFKPISAFTPEKCARTASFIYPDEDECPGSRRLFAALLVKCLERQVAIQCVLTRDRASSPRLVAVIPQAEVMGDDGIQVRPPGFHVVYLPYIQNIRKEVDKVLTVASVPSFDGVEAARSIGMALSNSRSFEPNQFRNPSLSLFYSVLESKALDEPLDEFVDETLPTPAALKQIRRAKSCLDEFANMYSLSDSAPAAKKAKVNVGGDVVENMARSGQLHKLTVPQLRTFCDERRLNTKTKLKADLMTAIRTHLQIE